VSFTRWSALGLSLALSADFARLAGHVAPLPEQESVLAWLSAGLAGAGALAAARGLRQRPGISAAAGVCVLSWAAIAWAAQGG
jgi:hypothetical protein